MAVPITSPKKVRDDNSEHKSFCSKCNSYHHSFLPCGHFVSNNTSIGVSFCTGPYPSNISSKPKAKK